MSVSPSNYDLHPNLMVDVQTAIETAIANYFKAACKEGVGVSFNNSSSLVREMKRFVSDVVYFSVVQNYVSQTRDITRDSQV